MEVYRGILVEDVQGTRLVHMIDSVHFTQQMADIAYDGNSLHESYLPDDVLSAFRQFLHCEHPELRDRTWQRVLPSLLYLPRLWS